MRMAVYGLLLDIGGVVIRTPFELLAAAERRHGLPDGALGPRGVFEIDQDPEFADVRDGHLTERAYWARRAERAAPLLRTEPDTGAFMREIFAAPDAAILRPETLSLVGEAAATGIRIGLLTNDVKDFHGDGWIESKPFFAHVTTMVDGSVTGVLKPDPDAFRRGIAAMALPADQVLFVDDQPANVAGSQTAGLPTTWFDVTDPTTSIATVRARLGLA